MKRLVLIAIVTVLPIAVGLQSAARAESAPALEPENSRSLDTSNAADPAPLPSSELNTAPNNAPNATQNNTQNSETLQPLSVGQNAELVTPDARGARLNDQASQINQTLERPASSSRILEELIQLPDGMIIRGSSRGGIGIGREY